MNNWKIIFATVMIFAAGFMAGGALIHKFGPRLFSSSNGPVFQPWEIREEYIRRLVEDLDLTAEQQETISTAVKESQQRVKILFELIGPEMREEMQGVRDSIRAVLTPEQQAKFEESRKKRRFGSRDGRKRQRGNESRTNTVPDQ